MFNIWSNGNDCTCLIEPKLIAQEAWQRKLNWDEDLPQDLSDNFDKWQTELPYIEQISIPRYYNFDISKLFTELHIFADASSLAYGAVVYLRNINKNYNCKLSFVIG